jgi:hypothetical protein
MSDSTVVCTPFFSRGTHHLCSVKEKMVMYNGLLIVYGIGNIELLVECPCVATRHFKTSRFYLFSHTCPGLKVRMIL